MQFQNFKNPPLITIHSTPSPPCLPLSQKITLKKVKQELEDILEQGCYLRVGLKSAVDFISFILLWLQQLYITTSIQSYIMPKYVLKEDVEKGLVDPTKSLDQQPEYKQKIEKAAQEKHKQQEEKKPQNLRPKKEFPPRNPRPKFNWNKEDITDQTKPAEKPKKILEKPNKEKYFEGFEKLKAERETIKLERKNLYDEQRNIIRDLNDSKKTGKLAINQYSGTMKEKFNTENQLRKEIRALDDVKKRVSSDLDALQYRFNELRKPSTSESFSLEDLHQKIQLKEHQLTTGDINKRQQSRLYNEINELKRALQKARPSIEIESEVGKLKDQIDILYKELKAIKKQLHVKITEANAIRAELDTLKAQRKNEQGIASEQKTVEQIKLEYDEKLKAVDIKRDKLEDKIDEYVDKHNREIDEYEDQQDLLNHIKWVEEQIERLHKRKEEDERRKKEKEQYEKRKLKEKEEYEKRKEERKKGDEERKARDEQRRVRLEKQREAFLSRNPNHVQIDQCGVLIEYCQNLRPSSVKYEERNQKPAGQIKFGKEWQKELKGGAAIITSKKANLDQQVPKKQPKQKKKEQKPEDQEFSHGIQVINQFQKLKLLPPNNVNQIDSTIKLIQDKLAFYNNPTEEERAAFREKATKEFDERNGAREQRDRRDYKQKNQEDGKHEEKAERTEKPKRKEKKELSEQDFPGLA